MKRSKQQPYFSIKIYVAGVRMNRLFQSFLMSTHRNCFYGELTKSIVLSIIIKYTPYLSCVIKKPDFCICENKDTDQLRCNRTADQRLCFHYIDSPIPLLPKSEISNFLAIFCGCAARFVSDLVGNPENKFFHDLVHSVLPMPVNSPN